MHLRNTLFTHLQITLTTILDPIRTVTPTTLRRPLLIILRQNPIQFRLRFTPFLVGWFRAATLPGLLEFLTAIETYEQLAAPS